MSDNILNVSRRGFLQGMVSTGALILSVRLVPEVLWAAETAAATHADRAVLHPSVFVGIDTDGTVYIWWRTARRWAPAAALLSH